MGGSKHRVTPSDILCRRGHPIRKLLRPRYFIYKNSYKLHFQGVMTRLNHDANKSESASGQRPHTTRLGAKAPFP